MWNRDRPSREHWHTHYRHHKPDWWPENADWPPVRPEWRERRKSFARRLGCLLGLVILFGVLVFATLVGLIANLLGLIHVSNPLPWVIPAGVMLFVIGITSLIWAGRGLQRISRPLGELMEASGRIAEGDYSQRVIERGPSEIRSLLRAFNSMAAKLQLTEEQRRDLMADISHELRTPLTILQGNLEGMLDGVYAPDEERLKSLLEETQVLARLVEDLRTLALAESGALQLKKESADLAALIEETAAVFRAPAEAAGILLEIQTDPKAGWMDLDPERMRQVISNLIANALRYTPEGGAVHVRHRFVESGEEKSVEVCIEDNGTGISPEMLPNIFNRFYRSSDSGGMGLGLPIARYLVEAHGGTIEASSQPGMGTRICLQLPFAG
jgi:two-component system sensor histidine kinase BaeS